MEGNFVSDMRLEDSDEVLQLPIVKNRVKKMLQGAVRKIALLGAPVIPSSDDTLEQFLVSAGRFFGKDPQKWEQVGDTKVDVAEENGKRVTRSTGVYSGTELHLLVELPYFDERLPVREDKPELNFNIKKRPINTDDEWQELIVDQPWTPARRRQMLTAYLQAKVEGDDGELATEGAHGFWELSINKEHHTDIRMDRLAALLNKLNSSNLEVATTTAAAVWGLATSAPSRRSLADLDAVSILVANIKRSLKLPVQPDPEDPRRPPEGPPTESQRNKFQSFLLGALFVLLVDRSCRRPYLQLEPDFSTLFVLMRNLDGYSPAAAALRRETVAKLMTSMVQRDGGVRYSLINTGALKLVMALLNPEGPGGTMIQFCMASLLATLVLDDDAMDLIKDRGEAPMLFEACIVLVSSTLEKLKMEVARQAGTILEDELEGLDVDAVLSAPPFDLELGVRLAEAASQAMWGSAHYCVLMDPIQLKMEHVVTLGHMGMDCFNTTELPLSRVCHCITASMATLAANPDAAEMMMTAPDDIPLHMLMTLVECYETETFERASHVKASACAGIAFLACHPIGAEGDECMVGPYREKLLSLGAFGSLLRAALTSVIDAECDEIIQQAAAIGAMYLSTMAGAVDPAELAMYSTLLMSSDNSEMIEFLMAGMWILLRNAANRKVLGTSFSPSPANALARGMMSKLNDAITLHDIHDHAQEQVSRIRAITSGGNDGRASSNGIGADSQQGGGGSGGSRPTSQGHSQGERNNSQSGNGARGSRGSDGSDDAPEPQDNNGLEDAEANGNGNGHVAGPGAEEQAPEDWEERRQSGGGASTSRSGGDGSGSGNGRRPNGTAESGAAGASRLGSGSQHEAQHRRGRGDASAERLDVRGGLDDDENNGRSGGGGGSSPGRSAGTSARPDRAAMRREAELARARGMKKKLEQLDSKFDKQLKENWGLETLVSVGESWLPAMIEQDATGEASDVPVLKLFEFLVASICLFMVDEDAAPERKDFDMFKLSAPDGANNKTWWTVDAHGPEPKAEVDLNTERALSILLQITRMRLPQAWKSLQLGILTLWNSCARSANMERWAVERGALVNLLNIIHNPTWPPSLRDISGGCLEFFVERHANLAFMGDMPLPADAEYAFSSPPSAGLVPFVSAMVVLIDSRQPLLEYRGCHGLGRVCYNAPGGTPSPKDFLKEAKATMAALGGIDAIIGLMKRVNRRYQELLAGKGPGGVAQRNSQKLRDGEDGALYERDMSTIDAVQDVYYVVFAALLNVSVLRPVQVPLAKKGLLVLLGTSTFLFGRVMGAKRPSAREEQLLNLCSAVVQNVSLHPQNRTRLYKAELKGSVAMDKLVEGAADSVPEDIRSNASAFLPSLVGTSSPVTGSRNASPAKKGKRHGGAVASRAGALNSSVDSALMASLRPKVVFPQIMDDRSMTTETHSVRASMLGVRQSMAGAMQHQNQSSSSFSPSPGQQPDMSVDADAEAMSTDSRARFLSWVDNTFADIDAGGSVVPFAKPSATSEGSKKTYRRQMFDDQGDWLEDEPESFKALNRLLCRPLNHLWQDTPEARQRQGKARWEPTVSEYREPKTPVRLTRPAQRLLQTKPPKDEEPLMVAATQLMASGKLELPPLTGLSPEASALASPTHGTTSYGAFTPGAGGGHEFGASGSGDGSPSGHRGSASRAPDSGWAEWSADLLPERPPTRSRENGRIGLTVLQPHPEHVTPPPPRETSKGGMLLDQSQAPEALVPLLSAPKEPVPLSVCLGPKRPRQVISFEDRIVLDSEGLLPTLTVFEHLEGSKVGKGLFPSYTLPNGKQAYMYYHGGAMLDEAHVDAVVPPPRPSTVPQALQQTMPLANVLNLIAKPPGSAPPFVPYKPVPRLVPLPSRHTLMVKRPDLLRAFAFGDLREDNLQLVIQAKKIIKTQTTTRTENIEVKPVEEREPWALPMSIFKPRAKESDARNFYDTQPTEEKMFERDWQRACAKDKFTSMMSRENKANKEGKDDKVMLKEVHDVLLRNYFKIYSAFVYYAAGGSGDPYHMSLNAFTTFLDECQIADSDSQFIKRSDCDTIFIVCNFQPDKKSAEAQVNVENALMRYEFIETIVRAALAKYGKGIETDDVAGAVEALVERNIVGNLPPMVTMHPNEFRQERLYTEEVDLLYKKHAVLLKAIYSRYRLKPVGGGLRPKVLKLDGWLQLMSDAHVVDAHFTLQDANLCFLWGRMYTIDEIKDYAKYTSLSFVDFLEALGRVADNKSVPSGSDLDLAGYNNVLEWAMDKERAEGGEENAGRGGEGDIFKPRTSCGFATPKSRPLYMKLEMLLDLMFRRLYWDPVQPEVAFNYDNLLKLIKKIDKDLGP